MNAVHPALHPPPAPVSTRTVFYCRRMDAHLATLPDDAARRRWLSKELVNWTALYERFCDMVNSGKCVDQGTDVPDVYDYLFTLCEISTRRERLAAPSARVWDVP